MTRIKAVLAALATIAAVLVVAPASAQASGETCYWITAKSNSNCDNMTSTDTMLPECWQGPYTQPRSATVYSGSAGTITVYLGYFQGLTGQCRSVMARMLISVNNGTTLTNCYARLQRASDGKTLYSWGTTSIRQTDLLYDAGTTSAAWATCTVNGTSYSNGTTGY
ncbi:hypothetical protein Cs7R123_53380 [Catellatospora sp. TT07R-123]|uniref:hypothetical protein n=1 Tax=Catellatospora sp. TT07R-123 TaxID=2733863 RepID=UPI001B144749|nr:hypothetical protein [Catellatospora sp. TT07R-123]GHJ47996.1 hypothetical protein Cs7R123_53380 [Catellatospora sp. TT07R-123]